MGKIASQYPVTGVFMKGHEDDLDERVVLQKMALMVIQARPILGVGPGAYSMEFRNYAVDRGFNGYWAFTVHNHYMLRAAEAGLQGMLAMLWMFWRGWSLAWGAMQLRSPVASRLGLAVPPERDPPAVGRPGRRHRRSARQRGGRRDDSVDGQGGPVLPVNQRGRETPRRCQRQLGSHP